MHYVLIESFSLPSDHAIFDTLPDSGRLLAYDGTNLLQETFALSREFRVVASVDLGSPGMLRVSPNGTMAFAIQSNGKKFVVFDPKTGNITHTFDAVNRFYFDGEWTNDGLIAITEAGADEGPLVRIFNISDGTNRVVVNNIGAASGGVTFSSEDRLYAGNGFSDNADDETGEVKVFESAEWRSSSSPIDFEAMGSGTLVANLLSGAFMGFDRFHNLYIGGGDVFSSAQDFDYAAVVLRSTLDSIINMGSSHVNPNSPRVPDQPQGLWQRVDPDMSQNQSWVANANRLTGEFLITPFETNLCYSYLLAQITRANVVKQVEFQANFHLGDTPSAFPNAPFCGSMLSIGFPLPDPAKFTGDFTLLIKASQIETWLNSKGHQIRLGGNLLPERLKDIGNQNEPDEFEFVIARSTYESIYTSQNPHRLAIEVEPVCGGGSDDFILTSFGYRINET